jgi:S1-C subfamily serine protease
MVNGASGSMIYWDEEEKTGYILTAYHVIEHDLDHGHVTEIRWRRWPDADIHYYEAEVHDFDEDNDLILLTVKFKHDVIFEVMATEEYNKLKPGRVIMSAGYPFNINSIFIGVGPLRDPHYEVEGCPDNEECHLNYLKGRQMLYHGATGWNGHSGGPIIDVETRKLIGIETDFGPGHHSTSSLGVGADVINEFLKNTLSEALQYSN